jgi:hypothetical protein
MVATQFDRSSKYKRLMTERKSIATITIYQTKHKTPRSFRDTGSVINATINHHAGLNGALTDWTSFKKF